MKRMTPPSLCMYILRRVPPHRGGFSVICNIPSSVFEIFTSFISLALHSNPGWKKDAVPFIEYSPVFP